jgi:hypothetical protein
MAKGDSNDSDCNAMLREALWVFVPSCLRVCDGATVRWIIRVFCRLVCDAATIESLDLGARSRRAVE